MTSKKASRPADLWPRKAWAACLNLSGLWANKPLRIHRRANDDFDVFSDEPQETTYEYWARDGNLRVVELGIYVLDGCITFASEDKKDVELFIQQVQKAQKLALNAVKVPTQTEFKGKVEGTLAVHLMLRHWAELE